MGTTFNIGDQIGDCGTCQSQVTYDGGLNASCRQCGATYNVDFEENETGQGEAPQELPPEPPPPQEPEARPQSISDEPTAIQTPDVSNNQPEVGIDGPTSVDPVSPIVDSGDTDEVIEVGKIDVGALTLEVTASTAGKRSMLKLNDEIGYADHVPLHFKKARAWRYGQVMAQSGNPYREGCKSWEIFQLFAEPCTMLEAINNYVGRTNPDKFTYMLTMHEVVTQCLVAGLLIIDLETRIINVCQGVPQLGPMM